MESYVGCVYRKKIAPATRNPTTESIIFTIPLTHNMALFLQCRTPRTSDEARRLTDVRTVATDRNDCYAMLCVGAYATVQALPHLSACRTVLPIPAAIHSSRVVSPQE